MKILVLGNGFMGSRVAKYFSADVLTGEISTITSEILNKYDVVINTIAKTNVDWCEQNKFECFRVNTYEAGRIARDFKGKYVFISSGCIFKSVSDTDIKREDSLPKPLCFYTYSKATAETVVFSASPNSIILRPRLLTSFDVHEKNTLDKILKYSKLTNNQESFTLIEDLLPVMDELIRTNAVGIFNVVNSGTISPSEIGFIFAKDHEITTNKALVGPGKVERVSVVMTSGRLRLLPDINQRIVEIKGHREHK